MIVLNRVDEVNSIAKEIVYFYEIIICLFNIFQANPTPTFIALSIFIDMGFKHVAYGFLVVVVMVQDGVALVNQTHIRTLTSDSFDNELANKPHFVLFFTPW